MIFGTLEGVVVRTNGNGSDKTTSSTHIKHCVEKPLHE